MIIDNNFLDDDAVAKIYGHVALSDMPWKSSGSTINPKELVPTESLEVLDSPYSVHEGLVGGIKMSPLADVGLNILNLFCAKHGIEIEKVIRIKANRYSSANNNTKTHPPHIDDSKSHSVLLYYVNNSDGDTILYKEKLKDIKKDEFGQTQFTVDSRVTPEAGKAIMFDGLTYHSSSDPIESESRYVININFVAKGC